jgi:hypothetical protein
MPSWANSTDGSPYSFSKAHLAPVLLANHHSASRTLTTNQPWVTGVSPDLGVLEPCYGHGRDSRRARMGTGGDWRRRLSGLPCSGSLGFAWCPLPYSPKLTIGKPRVTQFAQIATSLCATFRSNPGYTTGRSFFPGGDDEKETETVL